jgi:transcriptional regulator with XRE-family HTH domain
MKPCIDDKTNGLGKHLKALRKMAGLTQAELAQRCGLERTSITNIEAGRQTLSVQRINAIAAALGYRVKVKFERQL